MRTTVRLPDDLLDRARRKAVREGTTLTALLESGLRAMLAEAPHSATAAKRKLPRISQATGGLMPGIDPVKLSSEIEETEDIEGLRPGSRR